MGVLDDAIRQHLELKRKHGAAEEELQRQEEEALGPARREGAQQLGSADPAAAEAGQAEAGSEAVGGPQLAEEPVAEDRPADGLAVGEAALFDGEGEPSASDGHEAESEAPTELRGAPTSEPSEDAAVAQSGLEDAPVESQPPAEPDASLESDAPAEPVAHEADSDPFAGNEPFAEPPAAGRSGDTPPRGIAPVQEPDDVVPPSRVPSEEPDPGATQEYDPFADPHEDDDDDEQLPAAGEEAEEGDADVLEDTPDFLQETPEHDRLWFEQKPPRDFDFD